MIADAGKMHPDEQEIDPGLVRRLITEQFPQWADLPLVRVAPTGTDNALYRPGPDLVVRLPRIHGAVGDATKEHRLLPALAPYLPVPIPAPVALGTPAAGYPWEWSVYRWLPGESALTAPVPDPELLATQLAEFVSAMHRVDLPGGPAAGRGAPVRSRDQVVRRGIEAVGQLDTEPVDPAPLTEIWEGVLAPPTVGIARNIIRELLAEQTAVTR